MKVWRLCKERYCDRAFTGEGARLTGGRWNPPGLPMVYTSTSLSLAVIEVFVHLDVRQAPDDFVYVAAEIPVDLEQFEADKGTVLQLLPTDWKSVDNEVLASAGAEWAASLRSLTLPVPSVVVHGEWNVLINPAHPEAQKIQVNAPVPFHFDRRMFR